MGSEKPPLQGGRQGAYLQRQHRGQSERSRPLAPGPAETAVRSEGTQGGEVGARQDKEQAERGERGPGWRGDKPLSPAWTASAPHHRAHSTEANSISRKPNSSPEPQVQTSSPSAQALLGTPSPPRGPSPQPQKSLDPQLPGSPSSAARGPTHLPGIRERPAAEEEERRSEGPPRGGSHAVCDDLRGSWSAGRRAAGLDQEAGFTRGQALGGQGSLLAPPGRACAGLGPDSEDGHPACPPGNSGWGRGWGVGGGGIHLPAV